VKNHVIESLPSDRDAQLIHMREIYSQDITGQMILIKENFLLDLLFESAANWTKTQQGVDDTSLPRGCKASAWDPA
jgi:hypothetical protein